MKMLSLTLRFRHSVVANSTVTDKLASNTTECFWELFNFPSTCDSVDQADRLQTSISKLVILDFQKLFRWPIRIQVRFGAQSSSAQGDSCIYKSGFWAFSDLYIELLNCVSVSVPAHLHYRISGIFTHFYLFFSRLLKYIRKQYSHNIILKAV